jgi:antirestriction protein
MSALDTGVILAIGTDEVSFTPRVWVGCLSCYNSGSLFGKWIDGVECDDLESAGIATVETVGEYTAYRCVKCFGDEFSVMDHENFLGLITGECSTTEAAEAARQLADIADDSEREIVIAWLSNGMEFDLDNMRESYIGEYSSDQDMAEEYLESTGMLDDAPEFLARYFDYESFARDLMHDIFEVSGHYFRSY